MSCKTAVSDCNEEAPENKQDAKLGLKEEKEKKLSLLTYRNLMENGPSQKFTQVINCILSLTGVLELLSVSVMIQTVNLLCTPWQNTGRCFMEGRRGERSILLLIVILLLFLC